MENITWYSLDKELNRKKESVLVRFEEAEIIIDNYFEKWKDIATESVKEEYQQNGDIALASLTFFSFQSNDGSELEIEILFDEQNAINFQLRFKLKKYSFPLFSFIKNTETHETADIANVKKIVRAFFEQNVTSFQSTFKNFQ